LATVSAIKAASSAARAGVFVPIPIPYTQVKPVAWRNSARFLTASTVTA
jgi:hypothetical protein